ncbi:hypothetical protein ACFWD7_45895 [Streptomyces mirabilis]|uniref:hypothetical protein n=1 Tax=Streptomyces mirabilis TaxID=68239 RepID=UPI0021C12DC6|nr:hypothetical protein [Streptomyces mirabilis]MCT9113471.1 hypothetical protein [Streptomyces mirabilis]
MPTESVVVAGEVIDARREVGVVGRQIRVRNRQGADEGGGIQRPAGYDLLFGHPQPV